MLDTAIQPNSYKECLLTHADSLADSSHTTAVQPVAGVYTLGELLDRSTTAVPQLVSPLIPRQGVAMLAGSSDTGKSSFLRQLALAVAMGEPDFLGFPINAVHKRAICVSTEDGDDAVAPLLKMQLRGREVQAEARERLRFVFLTEDLPKKLDDMLTEQAADLIVVDALGDLYAGSLNQSNEVRHFINQYSEIATKHDCSVLFMHHTGKRTEDREPSKHNLLGSQGLEAKMRVVFELRADPYQPDVRHLCVVKGNYLPREAKEKSYALFFNENLLFQNTGERAAFSDLIKMSAENTSEREFWSQAEQLLSEGNSFESIARRLEPFAKERGIKPVSKSAIHRRLSKPVQSTIPPSQGLSSGMVGCESTTSSESQIQIEFTPDDVACLFVHGNTTAQLLTELRAYHIDKGDAKELFEQLKQRHHIEPVPSDKGRWRISGRNH